VPRLSEPDTAVDKAGASTPAVHAERQTSKPNTQHIADAFSQTPTDETRPTSPMVRAERQPSKPNGRHIAYALRRQVYARDEGRCRFVSRDGTRCRARGNLEFHHIVPFARGGEATLDNICLMCRSHNALVANALRSRVRQATHRGSERCAKRGIATQWPLPRDGAAPRAPCISIGKTGNYSYNCTGSRPSVSGA